MKVATKEELEAHEQATIRGAAEGIAAGLILSVPTSFYLHRKWAYYRSLPIGLKALGVIVVTAPLYAIQAERRGVEYDKSTWTGAGKMELERQVAEEHSRWEALSSKEKMKDWALRNQYKLILGSWALSMGVAGAIVMRNKYQTSAQKIVQVRMWAQGLTVGVLIGAGVLTQTQRKEAHEHRAVDHSWANILEEQKKVDRETAALQLLPVAPTPASASA